MEGCKDARMKGWKEHGKEKGKEKDERIKRLKA